MAGGGSLSGDARLRTPMSWSGNTGTAGFTSGTPYRSLSANVGTFNVAFEQADPNSLLSFYKAMIGLRRALPAIASGAYEGSVVAGSAVGFQRRLGSERAVVVINWVRR